MYSHSGVLLNILSGHRLLVNSVAVAKHEKQSISGSWDRTARLWNLETLETTHVIEAHTWAVRSVAFSRDGGWCVTGSTDTTARVWDAVSGSNVHVLAAHTGRVSGVAASDKGDLVATGSKDTRILLWAYATGQILGELCGHVAEVTSLSFSPVTGQRLLSASVDESVRLWHVESLTQLRVVEHHTDIVWSVCWADATATRAWTCSEDRLACLVDLFALDRVRIALLAHWAKAKGVPVDLCSLVKRFLF